LNFSLLAFVEASAAKKFSCLNCLPAFFAVPESSINAPGVAPIAVPESSINAPGVAPINS